MINDRSGWIGVDFDRTLAEYTWDGDPTKIGRPIKKMVDRVKAWLAKGQEVKVFTARVSLHGTPDINGVPYDAITPVKEWCKEHIGQELDVTNVKDGGCIQLWDDIAIQIIENTGERVDGNN